MRHSSTKEMVERVNQAQVERDAASAAFKSRSFVVWPAELPSQPNKPKPQMVLGVGFVALARGSLGYNAAMSRGLSRRKLAAIPLRRGEAAQTTMSTRLRAG